MPPDPRPPQPADLLALVRQLFAGGRVFYTDHANERMEERGFDQEDVKRIVMKGRVAGPISAGKKRGDWECKIVSPLLDTSRAAGVVTCVNKGNRLIIVTVEWEDSR
jgi:hypothetical protein